MSATKYKRRGRPTQPRNAKARDDYAALRVTNAVRDALLRRGRPEDSIDDILRRLLKLPRRRSHRARIGTCTECGKSVELEGAAKNAMCEQCATDRIKRMALKNP